MYNLGSRPVDYLRVVLITSRQTATKGARSRQEKRLPVSRWRIKRSPRVNPRGSRLPGVPRVKPRGELADIQWQGSAKNLSQLPFKRQTPLVSCPDTGSVLTARCCGILAITVISGHVTITSIID